MSVPMRGRGLENCGLRDYSGLEATRTFARYVVPVISDIGISVATGIIISFPLLYVREVWRICLYILGT